jgi:hypothetical protein
MNVELQDFVERYRAGFESYLRDRDERALNGAYELGRSAVAHDLSLLDLAVTYQEVLLAHLNSEPDCTAHAELVRASGDFLIESVSAFEVVQRALQQTRETAVVERRHATILRRLSSFLADASLALDASESLHEMLQLVAEHARELTGAEHCTARLTVDGAGATPTVDAGDVDQRDPDVEAQVEELAALHRALRPPEGSVRMTGAELDRHRADQTLAEVPPGVWKPRGWLAAPLSALDGRQFGLIQVFDKHEGDFSELDEAMLVQLAQMASAAVERAQLYRPAREGVPAAPIPDTERTVQRDTTPE